MKSNIILGDKCSVNLFLEDGSKRTISVSLTEALKLVEMRNDSIEGFHNYMNLFVKK